MKLRSDDRSSLPEKEAIATIPITARYIESHHLRTCFDGTRHSTSLGTTRHQHCFTTFPLVQTHLRLFFFLILASQIQDMGHLIVDLELDRTGACNRIILCACVQQKWTADDTQDRKCVVRISVCFLLERNERIACSLDNLLAWLSTINIETAKELAVIVTRKHWRIVQPMRAANFD